MKNKNQNVFRLSAGVLLLALLAGIVNFPVPPVAAEASFDAAVNYSAGVNPRRLFVADFNSDGNADMATANSNSSNISIFLNNGDGTFAAAVNATAGTNPFGISGSDFDRDGDVDLAAANFSSNDVSIFMNDGSGSFAAAVNYSAGAGNFPRDITAGDFDRDGDGDLALADDSNEISLLLNDGTGAFAAAVDYSNGTDTPQSIWPDDFDRDGDLDLVTANYSADTISVFLNDGSAVFGVPDSYSVAGGPFFVTSGDVDTDGDRDLAVQASSASDAAILLNDGSGLFGAATYYDIPGSAGANQTSDALFDFDRDGDLDLVASSSGTASLAVFLNDGSGVYDAGTSYALPDAGAFVMPADFDQDGDGDLVTANLGTNNVSILLNAGTNTSPGTFQPAVDYAVGSFPTNGWSDDFNLDGSPDMAVSSFGDDSVAVLINNGDGTFAAAVDYATGSDSQGVFSGDFNVDGKPDLAVANEVTDDVSILLGNGDGTFAASVNYTVENAPFGLSGGDFNHDGRLDLVAANNNGGSISVLMNNGDGTFAATVNYPAVGLTQGVSTGDYNRDGSIDIAASNQSGSTVSVFLNNGDGTFAAALNYSTDSSPIRVVSADFNVDGKLDLATANNGGNSISLLLGNGDGTFAATVDYPVTGNPNVLVTADFNNDARYDIATPNNSGNTVSVLLNNGDGTFPADVQYVIGTNPFGIFSADFNTDGISDLAVVNLGVDTVSVLLATGGGNMAPIVGFTVDHVIPAAQISQATDASGVLTVNFKVRDAESDTVTLTDFEYSTDQGVNWNAVSTGSAAFGGSWPDNGGPGFATSSAFGSTFSFTVDTQHADLLGFNAFDFSNARIRWKADDGTNVSVSPAESEPFVIDNVPAQTNDLSLVDNLGFQGRDDSLVSLDNGQTIYASYQNYDSGIPRLRFAKSTDAGATWTTSTVDNNADTGYYTSLTAVDADTIFISAGTVGSLTVYKSTDAGDTWTPIVVDTITLAFYTSISAVDADTIFVSYITNLFGELRVARSTDGGDTWDIETVDPDPGPSATSLFAVDANTAYVSYLENDNTLNFAKSTDGGDTWMLVSANPAINSGLFSSLVATDANHIYMTWYDQGDGSLGFSKSTDAGDTWQHSQIAAQGGSSSLKAFDVDHLMVAFIENNVLSLAESIDAGDTWSVTLLDATYAPQLPSLALVSEEKQYISYNDSTANTLRIARLLPDITLESRPVSGSDPLVMVEFGERNPDTNDFQAERNNAGYGPVVPGQSNTTAPAPQATSVGAFLAGDDVVTKVKVSLVDDFGNASVLENTSLPVELATVLPLTPDVPDVRDITPTQVTVEVIPNAGELGDVEYSIRFVSTVTEYVQAGGALGGTPFFQTLSGWGGATGISVTGLTAGTSYTVSVNARNPNGDAVETPYSTGVNLSPASGGSRHRFVEEPSQVSAENPAAGSVGGAAPVLSGGAPHEAAGGEVLPQVLGNGLKILAQLNVLFSWMDPSDYELTSRSVRKLDQFKTILSMKKTLKVLAIVTGYSDGYAYRNPDREPIANAAELMKAIMISFSECYSDAQLERVLRHDYAENGWWWAGYWYFLDPLMQRFLGHDYVLWSSIKDVNILELLQVFLTDYCGGAEDRV